MMIPGGKVFWSYLMGLSKPQVLYGGFAVGLDWTGGRVAIHPGFIQSDYGHLGIGLYMM